MMTASTVVQIITFIQGTDNLISFIFAQVSYNELEM